MIIKLINDTSSLNRPSHTRHCPLNDSTLCIVQLLKLNLWMKNLRSDQLIQLKPQTLLENIFHSPVVSISCCEIIDRLWALRNVSASGISDAINLDAMRRRLIELWLESIGGIWMELVEKLCHKNKFKSSWKVWKKLFSAWNNLEKSIEIFRKKYLKIRLKLWSFRNSLNERMNECMKSSFFSQIHPVDLPSNLNWKQPLSLDSIYRHHLSHFINLSHINFSSLGLGCCCLQWRNRNLF